MYNTWSAIMGVESVDITRQLGPEDVLKLWNNVSEDVTFLICTAWDAAFDSHFLVRYE